MHFTYVDVYHALCTVCLTCHLCDIINKSLTFKHFSKIQLQHTGFQRSKKNMTSGVPPLTFSCPLQNLVYHKCKTIILFYLVFTSPINWSVCITQATRFIWTNHLETPPFLFIKIYKCLTLPGVFSLFTGASSGQLELFYWESCVCHLLSMHLEGINVNRGDMDLKAAA